MEIFIELKKLLKLLGIQQYTKFNRINLTALSLFVYCLFAMIAFLSFEQKTFVDFGNSFFGAVSFLLNLFTLSSYIFKQAKIRRLFDQFDEIIQESKFKHFFFSFFHFSIFSNTLCVPGIKVRAVHYEKVSAKIEKWSKISNLTIIKITLPITYLPKFLSSFYLFLNGHGSDSFTLNYPMW